MFSYWLCCLIKIFTVHNFAFSTYWVYLPIYLTCTLQYKLTVIMCLYENIILWFNVWEYISMYVKFTGMSYDIHVMAWLTMAAWVHRVPICVSHDLVFLLMMIIAYIKLLLDSMLTSRVCTENREVLKYWLCTTLWYRVLSSRHSWP